MKAQTKGEYCNILPKLYRLLEKYHQDDEDNIIYMAANNQHGAQEMLKK